jgi:aspartyl-tRNA(Asn)/glutamyl-tRNA(Gln) amidotransferase subunit B
VAQETVQWDAQNNRTVALRSKEDAHDYRYFPDPDLTPLIVTNEWIDECKKSLPELPGARRERFVTSFSLTPYMAEVLTSKKAIAEYFERTLKICHEPKLVANWVMGEVLRLEKEQNVDVSSLKITPERLGKLLSRVFDNVVSASAAKKVFMLSATDDKDPDEIINELGLKQISDTGALERIVKDIIAKSEAEVARYKAGDKKLMGFFVGEAMKATKGKGNPKEINRIVSSLIG